MNFTVSFTAITSTAITSTAVNIKSQSIGLSMLDNARKELNSNFPIECLKSSIDAMLKDVNNIEITEEQARDLGSLFEKTNFVSVSCPTACLNDCVDLELKTKIDDKGFTSVEYVHVINTKAVIDKWIFLGCPTTVVDWQRAEAIATSEKASFKS